MSLRAVRRCLLALACCASVAHAAPTRLSDVLEHADDGLGVSWQVRGEVPAQAARRAWLLHALNNPSLTLDAAARAQLAAWLAATPLTGRVPIAKADARWLQAHPAEDPLLAPDDRVVWPPRAHSVTLLRANGTVCQAHHQPGRSARDYLAVCAPDELIDRVWIAQPDGTVQRAGIAPWNAHAQDEPAPGAWLWAPPRAVNFSDEFSEQLIAHLATLGPAQDGGQAHTSRVLYPQPAREELFAPSTTPPRPAPSAGPVPRAIAWTPSDWGTIGLMQTPTARMAPAGEVRLNASHVAPYSRLNVFLQPFDWLEAGFRYTSISNRAYGPASLSGDQSYKDKSLDIKLALLREGPRTPALALGFRDMTGTGLFSGEYLVANKRTGLIDWSAGVQWGYGVGSGGLANPLALLGRRFETRRLDPGVGGQFSWSTYFSGRAAVFGGVALQVPGAPVSLKLEFDSNDYRAEPQTNNQSQRSHINLGATWRAARGMDVSLGLERGDTLMFAVNFYTDLAQLAADKPAAVRLAAHSLGATDWAAVAREIETLTDWRVHSIARLNGRVLVRFDQAQATWWRDRVDAASAVLHRVAGDDVEEFVFAYAPHGVPTGEHIVERAQWVAQHTSPLPPHARREAVLAGAGNAPRAPRVSPLYQSRPQFEAGLGLGFAQSLGGPDGFMLYQLYATHRAQWRLRDDTFVQSRLELGLIDNYDKFRYTGTSQLPRVRTFAREYATTATLRLAHLQATHIGRLGRDDFFSVYGGYLEPMFAGVGAEWLRRPFGSRLAFGLDINTVRQRDFAQDFALRDYHANTGHATLYWDTGWQGVLVKTAVGQYLAGDRGATLDVSRGFANGVRMGAYFTRTNVSAAQYGEGSFDKGVYVSIPFDALLDRRSRETGVLLWQPLTRDGGARLSRAVSLYDLTRVREPAALDYSPTPRALATAAPPSALTPRVMRTTDESAPRIARELTIALATQGFVDVRITPRGPGGWEARLVDTRPRTTRSAARAAAHAFVRNSPLDAQRLKIVLESNGIAVAAYEFFDLDQLAAYFDGQIGERELQATTAVTFAAPPRAPGPMFEADDSAAHLMDFYPAARVVEDVRAASSRAREIDWPRATGLAAGLLLASHALDARTDRFARAHGGGALAKVGDALPWLAGGGAIGFALLADDPTLAATGVAASEASVAALLGSVALKSLVKRPRPSSAGVDGQRSFPSNHSAVAWALVTPFARTYRAPEWYAAPLLTQLGRVQQRRHWLSDTVAGALLGYTMGVLFDDAAHARAARTRLLLGERSVGVAWEF